RLHARHCRATGRASEADTALTQAATVATRQGAALWSLRIALDLATIHNGAHTDLARAVAPFPPGADLPELQQARALMATTP
ncbi:MAG: hypothetical protein ACRC6I_16110, partial [Paracoccaceae bacterium]